MIESKFFSDLHTVDLPHPHYVRLEKPLVFYSNKVGIIVVPVGFITDLESIPLLKGTSKRAGVIHDYLCRFDSKPRVSKRVAASVYLEAMKSRDREIGASSWIKALWMFIRRVIKALVVRIAWGYFHKLPVLASFEEVCYA